MADARLSIELWSDLVCPYCWVGKTRLEAAIRRAGLDGKVDLVMRAFELDPAPRASGPLLEHLAHKFGGPAAAQAAARRVSAYGAPDGLAFDFDGAVASNTFDAHRLVLHAQARGLGAAVAERLMRAHFAERADLADHETLARLAAEAGLDAASARDALASGERADDVRRDEATARAYGVRGVPFFVLGGRLAVTGAQSAETFDEALRLALEPEGDESTGPA